MSQEILTGFVVVDGEEVLTYDKLRELGFIGPSIESEYLAGMHGISGLFQIRATPNQDGMMDDYGLSIALVHTPYFHDRRLASEPSTSLVVDIVKDEGDVIHFDHHQGFTKIAIQSNSDDSISVTGKLSIGMYQSSHPPQGINLREAIGWDSPMPVMPTPEDVLQQLGSQKSLEEQFSEAFSKATTSAPQAPQPAPWQQPVAPTPAPPTPEPAPRQSAPAAQGAPTPQPEVKAPMPSREQLLQSMFGPLL